MGGGRRGRKIVFLLKLRKKKLTLLKSSKCRFFETLIEGYLLNNEITFREVFRVNLQQFEYLLSLVKF
jgi:hypothetical protein